MLCHDIEYAAEILILELIIVFIIFYLMVIIFKPIQDFFQDFNLFEKDGEDWVAIEVGKECASLHQLNGFMVSDMLFQTDKLLDIRFAVFAVETQEGVVSRFFLSANSWPPPILANMIKLVGVLCFDMCPNGNFFIKSLVINFVLEPT